MGTITDYTGNLELSFLDYTMNDTPKYTVDECKARDATYAAPHQGYACACCNKETGEIKEQEIFMGDFPLMTEGGTFIINGAERVIVSQIVRSPGMYYGDTAGQGRQRMSTPPRSSLTAALGWSMRPTSTTCSMSASIRTASCPSPACCAPSGRGDRSGQILERVRRGSPHLKAHHLTRTPARPRRRACWRSITSCVPASPPRWTPPRRCLDSPVL